MPRPGIGARVGRVADRGTERATRGGSRTRRAGVRAWWGTRPDVGDGEEVGLEPVQATLWSALVGHDYAALPRAKVDHRDLLTCAVIPLLEPGGTRASAPSYACELAGHPADDPRHLAAANVLQTFVWNYASTVRPLLEAFPVAT